MRQPTFVPLERLGEVAGDGFCVAPVGPESFNHDGVGTAFVVMVDDGELRTEAFVFPIPAGGYAVSPLPCQVGGGLGIVIVDHSHRGLFTVGGRVEDTGRLRYIDGCSDTVLVAPVVRGDPCLNLLHLPAAVTQTDHSHPSARVGVVLSGVGICVLAGGARASLVERTVFVLPPDVTHRFETTVDHLLLVAWHPDSDCGPTDDDHPMLNRTLLPGSSARVR